MTKKIKVFASDNNLKELGELLSCDTSRKIIIALMKNEMYTNEISTKLDVRVNNVIHHIKKMEALDMLEIRQKQIIKNGEKHRFFKIKSNFFVVPDKTEEEINNTGLLKNLFKEGLKFAGISLIAVASYFISFKDHIQTPQDVDLSDSVVIVNNHFEALSISLVIGIIGLFVLYLRKK